MFHQGEVNRGISKQDCKTELLHTCFSNPSHLEFFKLFKRLAQETVLGDDALAAQVQG